MVPLFLSAFLIAVSQYNILAFHTLAELTFTSYVSVFDISLVVGHIFKLISFWFILQAIVISNLQIPFLEIVNQRNYNRNLFETSLIGLVLSKMAINLLWLLINYNLNLTFFLLVDLAKNEMKNSLKTMNIHQNDHQNY